MRATVLAAAAVFAAIGFSSAAGATPVATPAAHASRGGDPAITLARGGCGIGWHRMRWRDRFGRWHIRCVPNRRPY